jgi:hypothetical protein
VPVIEQSPCASPVHSQREPSQSHSGASTLGTGVASPVLQGAPWMGPKLVTPTNVIDQSHWVAASIWAAQRGLKNSRSLCPSTMQVHRSPSQLTE